MNLDPGRHLVTINHGDIKGLMSPMTMAFPVASPALFERIAAGDRVTFTLQRSAQGLAIIALIKQETSGEASIVLAIEHDLSQLTAPGPESPGGASGCQTCGGELYDEASGCEL